MFVRLTSAFVLFSHVCSYYKYFVYVFTWLWWQWLLITIPTIDTFYAATCSRCTQTNVLAKFSLHPPEKKIRRSVRWKGNHFVTEISSNPIINFQGQDVSFDGGGALSHMNQWSCKEKTGKPLKVFSLVSKIWSIISYFPGTPSRQAIHWTVGVPAGFRWCSKSRLTENSWDSMILRVFGPQNH